MILVSSSEVNCKEEHFSLVSRSQDRLQHLKVVHLAIYIFTVTHLLSVPVF